MATTETKIIQITVSAGEGIKQIKLLTDEIEALKSGQAALKKGNEAEKLQYEKNAIAIKEYSRQKQVLQREVQTEIKATQSAMGAYQKLQLEFTKASAKAKDLAASQGVNSKASIDASAKANALNEKLKTIDATMGLHNRTVGDYKNQIIAAVRELTTLKNETSKMEKEQKQLAASNQITTTRYKDLTISIDNNKKKIVESTKAIELQKTEMKALGMGTSGVTNQMSMMPGVLGTAASSVGRLGAAFNLLLNNPVVRTIALVAGFVAGIGYAIKSSMEFSAQMSKVKAVTGATNEEFQLLKQNAKDVGAVTTKTATEVGAMQFEFAKLGFTVSEILNATKASVDLSTASGAALARTAEVMGTTLRGFGLDASNATLVADTMAKSFSTSALDMEKFAESMKYISPIAKQTGVSLAEATSMLALLADRGISGSMAGTSLRMIMLRLGEESGSLTEKITKLSEKGLGLAAANEEVGQRAMTALLVLSDQVKLLPELTKRYTEVNGAVDEMARIMRDNLTGDITIAKSAWEGFMLSIEDGEGIFSNVARFFVQLWTGFLGDLTILGKDIKSFFTAIGDESDYFNLRVQNIVNAIKFSFNTLSAALKALTQGDLSKVKTLFTDMGEGLKQFSKEKVDMIFLASKAVRQLERDIRSANKQLTPEEQRLEQEALNERKAFRDKYKVDEITDNKILYQNKLADLKAGFDKELITEEEYKKAKKMIDAAYYAQLKAESDKQMAAITASKKAEEAKRLADLRAYLSEQNSIINERIREYEKSLEPKEATLLDKVTADAMAVLNASIESNSAIIAADDEAARKQIENAERVKQAKIQNAFDAANAGADILDGAFAFSNALAENELALWAEQNKGKANFDEEYAKKKAEIDHKQAVRNKIMQVVNSLINGAAAVVALLATPPLAVAAGIAAALQTAAIIATPIPSPESTGGGSGAGGRTSLPPDLTSKMAAPLSSSVASIQSTGGSNVITSGAANIGSIPTFDYESMAKAISKLPAPEVSLVELRTKQKQVDFIENVSTFKN